MICLVRTAPAIVALIAALRHNPSTRAKGIPATSGQGARGCCRLRHVRSAHYEPVASQIAQLGYDTILFTATAFQEPKVRRCGQRSSRLRGCRTPLPGKVGLVGFSLGGGQVLFYGSQWPDLAAVVIAWYPATTSIHDVAGFVGRLSVPVLMLAAEMDTYRGCCLVGTRARWLPPRPDGHLSSSRTRTRITISSMGIPLQSPALFRRPAADRSQTRAISQPLTAWPCWKAVPPSCLSRKAATASSAPNGRDPRAPPLGKTKISWFGAASNRVRPKRTGTTRSRSPCSKQDRSLDIADPRKRVETVPQQQGSRHE